MKLEAHGMGLLLVQLAQSGTEECHSLAKPEGGLSLGCQRRARQAVHS